MRLQVTGMRAILLHLLRHSKLAWGLAALFVAAFITGCSSSTPKSEIGIYLSDDIQDFYGYCPTLEVDIVGLTEVEQKRMLSYDIDRYFQPPEQFRKSLAPVTAKFSDQNMTAKFLDSDDDVWDTWDDKGVTHLGIIVNLPTVSEIKDIASDPRKLIIDLNKGFISASTHSIVVAGSGIIEVKNPPKTAKREELSSESASLDDGTDSVKDR